MTSTLVFGSNGFIGSHYVSFLNSRNVTHKLIPNFETFSKFLIQPSDFDIDLNPSVVWLCGKFGPASNRVFESKWYEHDLKSLELILLLLRRYNWAGRFVLLSTGGCIYKYTNQKCKETDLIFPNNDYGELKIAQEKLVTDSSLQNSILRVSNVFGTKLRINRSQNVLSYWISQIKKGKPCEVYGDLNSYRDYINILDLMSAISKASKMVNQKEILNIGSSEKTTLLELISIFNKLTNNEVSFLFDNYRTSDRVGYVLDISKAKDILDWQPQNSTLSDIRDFIGQELSLL